MIEKKEGFEQVFQELAHTLLVNDQSIKRRER